MAAARDYAVSLKSFSLEKHGRLNLVVRLDSLEEGVARLLGVSQQHAVVRLEEDRVVDGRVSDSQRSLHHDRLSRLPNAKNRHSCVREGTGIGTD